MTTLSARIRQAPSEVKRWLLDYTAQLNSGEAVSSITVTITPLTTVPEGTPDLVVNNIVIGPGGLQVVFYVSGGGDGINYEAKFLAVTSINQTFEDVVEVDIMEKT